MPDDELNGLFARQREADRQNVPSFHAMRTRSLESAPTGRSEAPAHWWGWVSASLAALVLAIGISQRTPPRPVPQQPAPFAQQLDAIDAALQKSLAVQHDLSAWQSPTDFLLSTDQHLHQP